MGDVDNLLRVVQTPAGLPRLSWPGHSVSPPNFAAFRADAKEQVEQTPTGIGDETLLAITTETWLEDSLTSSAPRLFYQVLTADNCNEPVFP